MPESEEWTWEDGPRSATAAGPLGRSPPIHHVAISVANLDASVAWYKEKLGFLEYWRMTTPAIAMMKLGQTSIELMCKPASVPSGKAFGTILDSVLTQGFAHVSFEVENAFDAMDAMLARGIKVFKHPMNPVEMFGGPNGLAPNLKLCFFYDLDGNLFQIWSGHSRSGLIK